MTLRSFSSAFHQMPIIVALRGIKESEVKETGKILLESGISIFEIPIRTKNAAISEFDLESKRSLIKMVELYGESIHVCAGTVMSESDVFELAQIGIESCFSLCLDPLVIKVAVKNKMSFFPGVETVSEAVSAIKSGAKGLKIFPCVFKEANGEVTVRHTPGYVKYLSHFVADPIIMSGNAFTESLIKSYLQAGASGINVGAQLYEPRIDSHKLADRAKRLTEAVKKSMI